MSDHPSRALESYTAPQDAPDEFKQLAEEDAVDPLAETASQRQIVSRQTDYQNRRFNINRESGVNTDASAASADDAANSHADTIRVAWLERERSNAPAVRSDEKERRACEEGSNETSKRSRWDQTPMATQVSNVLATPLRLGRAMSHCTLWVASSQLMRTNMTDIY
jgi:splicing factor 3B subunit 1